MTDWWSYGLADFLMFSPRTYQRMVQAYNQALWPAHVAAFGAGGLALAGAWRALTRSDGLGSRAALVLLALAWAWVGWAFHWQRFAQIYLAAPGYALACWLQAVLLLLLAVRPPPPRGASTAARRAGLLLAGIGLLAWPLLAPLRGRPLAQAEMFGLMPEPTALVTLGLLLLLPLGRWRGLAMALPLLSLAAGLLAWAAMAGE